MTEFICAAIFFAFGYISIYSYLMTKVYKERKEYLSQRKERCEKEIEIIEASLSEIKDTLLNGNLDKLDLYGQLKFSSKPLFEKYIFEGEQETKKIEKSLKILKWFRWWEIFTRY